VVCKHWLRGLCKKGNDQCEFLHEYDLTKMPPCHFFINFGKCSNPECPFLHVKPEDRAKDCAWYARGFCKHGPNCRNRHVRAVACGKYLAGFCPDGPNCTSGHPKYELPVEDTMVTKDGTVVTAKRTPLMCTRCGNLGHTSSYCRNSKDADGSLAQAKKKVQSEEKEVVIDGERIKLIQPIGQPKKRDAQGSLRKLELVTCFKCGERGHYANVCTNTRRAPPKDGYHLPGVSGPIVDPRVKRARTDSGPSTLTFSTDGSASTTSAADGEVPYSSLSSSSSSSSGGGATDGDIEATVTQDFGSRFSSSGADASASGSSWIMDY